jgi:MoaA/NifB/PqqE/SkfB family radical SAM enzyme
MSKEFVWFHDRNALSTLDVCGKNGKLLPSISIGCAAVCSFRCPHCVYGTVSKRPKQRGGLSAAQKLDLLHQAHELGAMTMQICHDGEPMIDPSTMPLVREAARLGLEPFLYTTAAQIDRRIAGEFFQLGVNLAVHCDALRPEVFDRMLGRAGGTARILRGIENLLHAGYDSPVRRDGKLYTRLELLCTLTKTNTADIEMVKEVARFAWKNNVFFGPGRFERGGEAVDDVWDEHHVTDRQKITGFIDWCSDQTGVNYWNAQPVPYCVGVAGVQVSHTGDVWISSYGGSCDFCEPDGESLPELAVIGNVLQESLGEIVERLWKIRRHKLESGVLDEYLQAYTKSRDAYPNGLEDCGSTRSCSIYEPYYRYVQRIVGEIPRLETE